MLKMANLLALFVISIALSFTPVLGDFPDIQVVCDQTPQMQQFGKYLSQNPDIYSFYASLRNITIYVPSDQAMTDHFAKTGRVFGRSTSSEAPAKYSADKNGGNMYGKMKQKRQSGPNQNAVTRSVRTTLDTDTSPTGRNSVLIKVNPGSTPNSNTTQSTGISLSTGAGIVSTIVFGDIQCLQGYLQVVDTVFTLPAPVTDTLTVTNRTKFLDSINAANLENSYNSADQITIFAPIDPAFTNQSTLNTAAIEYHVVAEDTAFYTPLLTDGLILKTVQGGNLYIRNVNNKDFYVNCVRVVQTDALTNNGVVHAVEKILTPLNAPPACEGLGPWPVTTSNSTSNSTSPEISTGLGSVGMAVNMMAVVGSVLAVVGIII